jgi:MSHA biogenesis protein MshO
MRKNKIKIKGFTMIELIIVISIAGIVATSIAMFLKSPVFSYDQTAKRAELADEAYLLIKKIKQDVRWSLPNSVRVSQVGNKYFLEMLTVSGGGKYRSQNNSAGTGDILDFTTTDTSFDILSPGLTFKGGEKIVVANMGSPSFDAYSNNNMTNYTGSTNIIVNKVTMSSIKFPLEAVNENFYVVDKVVSYVCDKDAKTLSKYWGYPISSSQPTNTTGVPLISGSSTLIAKNITDCSFLYDQGGNTRNGVVSIMFKLGNTAQTATLYGETYVPNT